METIRPTKCPHCWASLPSGVDPTCPHCDTLLSGPVEAAVPPIQPRPNQLSAAGRILTGVLLAMGVYAVTRCIDQVDRLQFLAGFRNGDFARQVALGQTTIAAMAAKAKALDHRNSLFVAVSWLGSFASMGAYRKWRFEQPVLAPHTPQTRFLQATASVAWVVALGAQIFRATSPIGGNLAAAHSDAMVNLMSRAVIIPAVMASIALIRLREGLPLWGNGPATAPSQPHPTGVTHPAMPNAPLPPGPPTFPS